MFKSYKWLINLIKNLWKKKIQLKAPEDKMDSLLLGRDKYHYDGDDNDEDEYGGQVQDQIIDYLNSLKVL